MNTYIDEIEKRFEYKAKELRFAIEQLEKRNLDGSTVVQINNAETIVNSRFDEIKAFFRAELPYLLSKFAAEINTRRMEVERESLVSSGWNAHHRSVAEKASQIIKSLET